MAVRSGSTQVLVSWRLLGLDPAGIGFNVYRSTGGGGTIQFAWVGDLDGEYDHVVDRLESPADRGCDGDAAWHDPLVHVVVGRQG